MMLTKTTKQLSKAALIGAMVLTSTTAAALDLNTWTAEGPGNWVVQPGNTTVLQTQNNGTTVFHNGQNSQGQQLSGSILSTDSDNDFIGFVLGYNAGDLNNASANYLLVDWKQSTQGVAGPGLAISQVSGAMFTSSNGSGTDAWDHTGPVTELQRATNLGSTGWVRNQTYSFDLVFTATLAEVFVDGVKELSVTGNYSNGAFGFYNLSQEDVTYGSITQVVVPPPNAVPVPAAAWLFGSGLLGLAGMRRRKA